MPSAYVDMSVCQSAVQREVASKPEVVASALSASTQEEEEEEEDGDDDDDEGLEEEDPKDFEAEAEAAKHACASEAASRTSGCTNASNACWAAATMPSDSSLEAYTFLEKKRRKKKERKKERKAERSKEQEAKKGEGGRNKSVVKNEQLARCHSPVSRPLS
jgi:hypothetical protein